MKITSKIYNIVLRIWIWEDIVPFWENTCLIVEFESLFSVPDSMKILERYF